MRDPARIPRILGLLRVAWERAPDLRLAQLLISAAAPAPGKLFYYEDDKMEAALVRWLAEHPP